MKNFFYFFVTMLFFSCSNEKSKDGDNLKSVDSLLVQNTTASFPFKQNEFKQFTLPFVIDTLFIQKVDTNNRITYQQVRSLGTTFLKSELGDGLSYEFNKFCEIDSLKQVGKYVDYVSKLDIGMTKISIAYKLGVIKLENNNNLFIWGINSSSYEADPFFVGTTIIASFVNAQNECVHFTIGVISNAGDPPSMGSDQITSKINADGKMDVDQVSISDDIDVPGEEITHTTFQLKVDGNNIVVSDSKKEVKNTEKAQQ